MCNLYYIPPVEYIRYDYWRAAHHYNKIVHNIIYNIFVIYNTVSAFHLCPRFCCPMPVITIHTYFLLPFNFRRWPPRVDGSGTYIYGLGHRVIVENPYIYIYVCVWFCSNDCNLYTRVRWYGPRENLFSCWLLLERCVCLSLAYIKHLSFVCAVIVLNIYYSGCMWTTKYFCS